MVDLRFAEQMIDLPRNGGLLDTNVLVAFGDDSDGMHEQALLVLYELEDYQWVVTLPVIVEACGLLGSRRSAVQVVALLRWLLIPSNALILPGSDPVRVPNERLLDETGWMVQHSIDYVDSHLMDLAHSLTLLFDLRPHMPIFTFDTTDFLRCASKGRRYSLYDMRSFELVSFG